MRWRNLENQTKQLKELSNNYIIMVYKLLQGNLKVQDTFGLENYMIPKLQKCSIYLFFALKSAQGQIMDTY